MEDSKISPPEPPDSQQPHLTSEAIGYLVTSAKWGKFLAILGFITVAFMIISGLLLSMVMNILGDKLTSGNAIFTAISPTVIGMIYIVIGIISSFPVFYLNAFSNNISKAVRNNETGNMTQAFKRLKNFFAFIGIYTIVLIAIYIIAIIVAASAALLAF
jgi:hypothetical protein